MTGRVARSLVGVGLLLVVVAGVRLLLGDPERLLSPPGVFLELRGLRVVIAVVVGAALGASGTLLQALLRNPLASPDLMGLSAGASLAVMIALLLGGGGEVMFGQTWQMGPALAGSMGALALVLLLSRGRGGSGVASGMEPGTLILIGVIVTVMCGAGVSLVQHLMPHRVDTGRALVGAIRESVSWWQVGAVGVLTVVGVVVGTWHGRAMDVASLSDDEAMTTGVRLSRLRLVLLTVAGVLAAGSVVLVGPIGFVGLIAPHVVRRVAGPAHGPLVVGAALTGAVLVVGADVVASLVPTRSGRLPIGVVTALVGGPVFLVLLRRVAR